jgi:hypothetical protein
MIPRRCSTRKTVAAAASVLMLLFAGLINLDAQDPQFPGVRYLRGQDVSPTFDGWAANPDGSFTLYFGYFNRNAEEEIDVPLGPENTFDLGNGDQGQPTHFYTGRKWWVFKVTVPKEWPRDKRVTWTLSNRGRTNLAKGWLQPEWEVVRSGQVLTGYRDRGAEYVVSADTAPFSLSGSQTQTITLPAVAILKVTAAETVASRDLASRGVQIRWTHYRGPGKVTFTPAVSAYGKPVTSETKVSFSEPGDYRIRAIATDNGLFWTYDIDVKVKAGG